jgi:hypothetical protein
VGILGGAHRGLVGWLVIAGGGLALSSCAEPGPEAPEAFDQGTRARMSEIAEDLRLLLPLSVSEERFAAEENRPRIEAALQRLAEDSLGLESHGGRGDAAFSELAGSLSRDVSDGLRRYEDGEVEEARFLVQELVENCVGCHSRREGPSSPALGPTLLAGIDRRDLSDAEWARLLVATRQFDAALDTYEESFGAEDSAAGRIDTEALAVDYLVVCVRVKGDLVRARHGLALLGGRADLPEYLSDVVAAWEASLARLAEVPAAGTDTLARARDLAASEGEPAPLVDRSRLIEDLVASGLLHDYVHAHPEPSPEAAEAYYLLGATELRIRPSFWVAPADAYLEAAIRMAPGALWAPEAFGLLEASSLLEYQGSAGEELPPDVQLRLDDLARLIEGA